MPGRTKGPRGGRGGVGDGGSGWAVWLWRHGRSALAGRRRLLTQTEVGFPSVPLTHPSISHPEGSPQGGTWGAVKCLGPCPGEAPGE